MTKHADLPELYKLLKKKQAECIYPNLYTLLVIGMTLPMTSSCTSERSFSVLRLVKSYLRSTMLEKRLSSLAVIYCNRNVNINIQCC